MATTNGHTTAVSDLDDSLRRAHQVCDMTGDNLPELLREALEQLATEVGGTEQLVRHRPGSWEAEKVTACWLARLGGDYEMSDLQDAARRLLDNIKRDHSELSELLARVSSEWVYEDLVYRFWHHSWKVY